MNKTFLTILNLIYRTLKGTEISSSAAYNPQKLEIISRTILNNMTVTAILSLVALFVWTKKRQWFTKIVLVLTILDLFIYPRGNLISMPLSLISQQNEAANFLLSHGGYGRFLSTSGVMPYTGFGVYWTHLRAREPFSPNQVTGDELRTFEILRRTLAVLPENQAMKYRLFDAAGYAAAVPKNYLKFFNSEPKSPNAITLTDLSLAQLNLVGVQYLVTGYPQDYVSLLEKENYKAAFQSGSVRIYENTAAFPRAFILSDTGIVSAEITDYKPTQVSLKTTYPKDASLVLTDTMYPGWEARVDGKTVPLTAYEGVFRLIQLPKGQHIVEYVYNPKSVKVGAIISLGSLIGFLAAIKWEKKRKSHWLS